MTTSFFVFPRNSNSGQQTSGNKPPLISGSPIQGARPDGENQENSYSPPHPGSGIFKTQNRHSIYADNVNAVYKISPHLYGKFYLRLLLMTI